ncbi:MAG: DUF3488 domain-containing transglutaminase family protein [Succinivibrionaceae bacterium]|nr:DUF3488 domain-containing transglutaminase family protein [Succinivibrionaceae bacterium]
MAEGQLAYQHQKRTMILFCICYALSVIPLIGVIDSVIVLISMSCIVYRYGEIINRFREHPKYLEKAVIVACVGLILFFLVKNGFRVHLVNAFIDLLICSIALKFLEQTRQHDLIVHIMSLLFLSAIPFIFHFDWYMLAYLLLVAFFDFCALMSLFAHQSMKHLFRYTFKTLAMALPLGAVVFVVLPRFNPFWQMPSNPVAATGLGEEIDFNSVSKLIEDSSVAFRVRFDGKIPRERYFTATFYPLFDMTRQSFLISGEMARFESRLGLFSRQDQRRRLPYNFSSGLTYHMFVEPSQRRWIPQLDPSLSDNDQIFYTSYRTWVDRVPITQPRYYKFKYIDSLTDQEYVLRTSIGRDQKDAATAYLLNTGYYRSNPKTRELVKQFQSQTSSDAEFARRILEHFRTENFRYTLSPARISPNSRHVIDEFLFSNRNGFCNHYSAATAYMLRLAGIPAMVAGGYLAGEINTEDDFVTVRNSDAHSWVVAAIDGHWVRIDPVTAIAPDRIEKSYYDLASPASIPVTSIERYRTNPVISWFRNKMDALEFRWNSMILNYNFSEEAGFLTGFFSEHAIAASIMLLLSFATVIYFTMLLARVLTRKNTRSLIAQEYFRFVDAMKEMGHERMISDTPESYLARLLPALRSQEMRNFAVLLTKTVNDILYRNAESEKEGLKRLKALRKPLDSAVRAELKARNG